jgi:hypothetical protein
MPSLLTNRRSKVQFALSESTISKIKRGLIYPLILIATQAVGLVIQFPLAAINRPLIDNGLARFDLSLGLDWLEMFHFVAGSSMLIQAASLAYGSLLFFSLAMCICAAVAWPKRARVMVLANAVTLILSIGISDLWPALGPMVYFRAPAVDHNALALEMARSGDWHLHLSGIVTFPSYHAELAVLAALAVPRAPAILGAALIILATPTMGDHYFADVLFGVFIALVAWSTISILSPGEEASL